MAKKISKKKERELISNIPSKQTEVIVDDGIIEYNEGITLGELSEKLNTPSSEIIKFLFMTGKMVTINTSLDDETVELVALEYNKEVKKNRYCKRYSF